MAAQTDLWLEYCRRLNKHYRQGNLRVLVGAGLSVDSGFPSWGELNRALLRQYIEEDLGRDPKAQPIIKRHLDELVSELYEAIGRDAAADFVWNSSTRENFFDDLRKTLYRDRSIAELPLTQVHWQLAAMDRATLFTTNFDPLLELARYRMHGGTSDDPDFAAYRSANAPPLGTEPNPEKIYHVHGWIDPDGICGGSFVLTEAQYFELFSRQGQRPNQILDYVLTSGGAVLILGMSLADVNLRRHLYLRSRNPISDSTEIYAVLRVHGRELLDTYQTLHWANQGVRVVFIREYHEVPRLLREIKFGLPADPAAPLPWMSQTLEWVQKNLPGDAIFTDRWQSKARSALLQLLSTLRESFAIPQHEIIQATLLGQVSLQEIAVFAETRHVANGKEARQYTNQFRLRVSGGLAQGVAGFAFSQGKLFEVLDDPDVADQNFTPEMKQFYANRGLRNWRSLIAIPILEMNDRLPVAVVVISSNLPQPFWVRFEQRNEAYRTQMIEAVGLTVRELFSEEIVPNRRTMKAER